MSSGPVIGVDAGGTKLLAGVVHEDLTVGHCVRRLWSGGDRAEVLDTMVEAVGAAGSGGGGGFGAGGGLRHPRSGGVRDGTVGLERPLAARRGAVPRRDGGAARAAG